MKAWFIDVSEELRDAELYFLKTEIDRFASAQLRGRPILTRPRATLSTLVIKSTDAPETASRHSYCATRLGKRTVLPS